MRGDKQMKPMYKAVVNSIRTELATDIDATQTTIPVLNASALQDAKLAVIGNGEIAETIRYASIENNELIGCERGFQGAAKPWGLGTKIARNFTAYDHDTTIDNINELNEQVQEMKQDIEDITPLSIGAETPTGAQLKADAAQTAAEQSAQGLADTLQTNLDGHTNAKIYSAPVHGLRVENDKLQFEKSDGSWKSASSDILLSDSITGMRSNVAASELAVSKVANRPYTDVTYIEARNTSNITNLQSYNHTVLKFKAEKDTLNELEESSIRLTENGTYYVKVSVDLIHQTAGNYIPPNFTFQIRLNQNGTDYAGESVVTSKDTFILNLTFREIIEVRGSSPFEVRVFATNNNTRINTSSLRVARIR
jgi:hypothetical protein